MRRGLGIKRWFDQLEAAMEGWPDSALTIFLLIAAAFLILVALRGHALEKAIIAAWITFP